MMNRPFTTFHASQPALLPRPLVGGETVRRAKTVPSLLVCSSGGNNIGDEMLDFLYAGKKLRKWYGQEGQVLPRERGIPQGFEPDDIPEEDDGTRDYVLLLEVDSVPMAEQVLLQLILARAKLRVQAQDGAAVKFGFGPYVDDIVGGSASDEALLRKACQGVKSVVICGRLTQPMLTVMVKAHVPHVVLFSAVNAPGSGGFRLFNNGELSVLEDATREDMLRGCGLPFTIVRIGKLKDSAGGASSLQVTKGNAVGGVISREDAAMVLAQAAVREIDAGSLQIALSSNGAGAPIADWQATFKDIAANAQ